MGDYIKIADAVKVLFDDCIRYVFPTTAEPTTEFIKLDNAINLLRLYPSADVEPVVRCKDCKCWTEWANGTGSCNRFALDWIGTDADDFCSMGEKRR